MSNILIFISPLACHLKFLASIWFTKRCLSLDIIGRDHTNRTADLLCFVGSHWSSLSPSHVLTTLFFYFSYTVICHKLDKHAYWRTLHGIKCNYLDPILICGLGIAFSTKNIFPKVSNIKLKLALDQFSFIFKLKRAKMSEIKE